MIMLLSMHNFSLCHMWSRETACRFLLLNNFFCIGTYTCYLVCSFSSIQTYIIDTWTCIFKCTSTRTYIIDTWIRVFVHAFTCVSVNVTYICIFIHTLLYVSVIDTLNIDFVWQLAKYVLVPIYIIILLINSTKHLPWLFLEPSFNITYLVAPLQS